MELSHSPVSASLISELESFELPEIDLNRILLDRWTAASLLQKAIRRSEVQYAWIATNKFLELNDRAFWRRLAIIVWEDVCFGDLELCAAVTAIAGSKRLRKELGNDLTIAMYLVRKLCQAPKNRLTDDLITVIEHGRRIEHLRERLGSTDAAGLNGFIYPSGRDIYHRAIAAWYKAGTIRFPSDQLLSRAGNIDDYFDGFCRCDAPTDLIDLCRVAVRRTQIILPIFVPLLWNKWCEGGKHSIIRTDQIPSHHMVGAIPSFTFDMHTRAGRRYIHSLGEQDSELAFFLCSELPSRLRRPFLRELYFKISSSLCARRQIWSATEQIHDDANTSACNLPAEIVKTGIGLLKQATDRYPISEMHL